MPHDQTPYPARYTPRRPWQRMTDQEWHALMPYILHRSGPGRPIRELRARMDGIFRIATSDQPWHTLPPEFGKPDTVSRHFRRMTHGGLWQKLARELVDFAESHPLRALESWICRACRRAKRLLGLGMIVLLRRINLRSALWAPPWLLPDPDLSESLHAEVFHALFPRPEPATPHPWPRKTWTRGMHWLIRAAQGRRRIRRSLQLAWP